MNKAIPRQFDKQKHESPQLQNDSCSISKNYSLILLADDFVNLSLIES
jgi:hypothetical protein